MGEAEPTVQTSVEKIYKINTTDQIVQFIQSKKSWHSNTSPRRQNRDRWQCSAEVTFGKDNTATRECYRVICVKKGCTVTCLDSDNRDAVLSDTPFTFEIFEINNLFQNW